MRLRKRHRAQHADIVHAVTQAAGAYTDVLGLLAVWATVPATRNDLVEVDAALQRLAAAIDHARTQIAGRL